MALLGFPGQTPPFVPGRGVPLPAPLPGTPPFIPGRGMPPQISSIPSPGGGGGGPAWLQRIMGGFDKFMGGLAGPASPLLSQDEQQAAMQRQRMAMAQALLQASAPVPKGASGPLAAIGAAMQAGRQAGDAFTADTLRTRLMQAQIEEAQRPTEAESPFGKLNVTDFTPESIAAFQASGGRDFSLLRRREDAPKESEAETKLRIVRETFGREPTEAEVSRILGIEPEESANVLNEQIPPTQIANVRLPDGSSPPLGTTWGQAREMGAKVYTAADLQRQEKIEGALHTLGELERMAFDEKTGVFVDSGGSILTDNIVARMAHGIANGLGALAGTDAAKRRSVFNRTSQGTISSLIRSMGESGALSDGDVNRALAILPKLGVTPDTEEEARAQFDELRTILTRGADKMEGRQEFDFDPQTGRLVPRR